MLFPAPSAAALGSLGLFVFTVPLMFGVIQFAVHHFTGCDHETPVYYATMQDEARAKECLGSIYEGKQKVDLEFERLQVACEQEKQEENENDAGAVYVIGVACGTVIVKAKR